MNMIKYRQHHTWLRRNSDLTFAVEINHGIGDVDRYGTGDGTNTWAVYAYIYPKHWLFDEIDINGGMFQDATDIPGGNWYCSYFRPHYNRELSEVVSVQFGWDYQHNNDTLCDVDCAENASRVFHDAETLFEYLNNESKPKVDDD